MKLIVGLGNPGAQYGKTRHNLGQMVVDSLVGEEDITARLYKPRSFMNLSGPEVAEQIRFHKLSPDDLLVIHDDLDFPFGEMRLQHGHSAAGHKGAESVIDELGTNAFWRLRIGIGPRKDGVLSEHFVLQKFSGPELKQITSDTLPRAKEIIIDWIKN